MLVHRPRKFPRWISWPIQRNSLGWIKIILERVLTSVDRTFFRVPLRHDYFVLNYDHDISLNWNSLEFEADARFIVEVCDSVKVFGAWFSFCPILGFPKIFLKTKANFVLLKSRLKNNKTWLYLVVRNCLYLSSRCNVWCYPCRSH